MAHLFDEVRAIVLNKGTKASKIERMQRELKLSAYEAATFYAQLSAEMSLAAAEITTATPRGAKRFTIGVEIECFGIEKDAVRDAIIARGLKAHCTGYDHNDSRDSYKLGYDGSIDGSGSCEVVSPILKNLNSLRTVCEVINEAGARVNKSCGLHVHFGAEKFTVKQWRRIILNYIAIEPVIDDFMPLSRRANNNQYCGPMYGYRSMILSEMDREFSSVSEFIGHYFSTRYLKLNARAWFAHKTIEFRQHSGTTEYEKIRNWVEFCSCFLAWSLEHEDEPLSASTIDDLPFISARLKRFYNKRANELRNVL